MSFKTVLKILFPVCLLLVLCVQCIIIFLPGISTHIVQSTLGPLPGNPSFDFTISRVGANYTQISNLSFGEDLRLDTIRFTFRMDTKNIISVEKIVISGLNATLHLDEKKRIQVSGFLFPQDKKVDHSGPVFNISAFESYFAYLPGHIVLKNSTIFIDTGKDRLCIPVEGDVRLDRDTRLADMKLSILPMNQKITLGVTADLSKGPVQMKISADGRVQINSPGIALSPFKFEILSQIASGTVAQFSLTLQNEIAKTWDITPELMELPLSTADFPDQIQFFDPQFRLFVSGNLEHQTGKLAFSGTSLKSFRNDNANHTDFMNTSGLQVKAEFDGNFGCPESLKHIKLDALVDKIAFQQHNRKMNTISLTASSDAVFTFSNSGIVLDMDVNAVCNKTKIVSGQATAFVRKAGIKGKIEKQTSSGICFQLKPFLSDTDITMKDKGIQAKGVYFELPVTYPFKDINAFGRAGIKKIILHDHIFPAVSAKVVQTSDLAMDIQGKVTGFPGLVIDFSAQTGLDSAMTPFAKGQITTNQSSITQNTLIPFVPGVFGGDNFKFDISARADFSYTNQKINSSADIQLTNGTLKSAESDLSASGISANIHFNDLMVPETIPGQYINIDMFHAGRFNFNNGKIRFSLEDGKSINIENLKFNWCNGIVSTEAFRLPSDDNAIHLTLYCDRLEMEDFFHQLGAFDSEGGGTLSGRIPVVMENTEIGFDNGFLFSTPGEGGRIFIKDLDRMLAGIPMNTPEFSQLDLAGEALKNFEYNWIKLKLNTHGDTLAVNMQLDGKPVSALPFEYNRNLKSFVRVNAQSPGSNFQGIKLDVNLTLPFNQVVQFGNNLKRIMNP